MKKKILILIMMVFLTSACLKQDDMQDIEIITTSYPLEYVVNYLYGDNSKVESIYPDGSDAKNVKFNAKQLKDFSNKDLYAYLGKVKKQSDIAVELKNNNRKLLLIDGSLGIDIEYGVEETWIDPSNMLMIVQNVRKGLNEYVKSTYLTKNIEEKYELLKVELSNLDAEFRLAASNADRKIIVVSNNALNFLSKYGFEVISIGDEIVPEKIIADIQNLINNNQIQYIYSLEHEEKNEYLDQLMRETAVKNLVFKSTETITDEERKSDLNYISLMRENINLIKEGTYNK